MFGPDWKTLEKRLGDRLPHWFCERAIYHVTFRQADSIPEPSRLNILAEREAILDNIHAQNREATDYERSRLWNLYSEKIETCLKAGYGSCRLGKREVREEMIKILEHFHEKRYRLHAYCIMPNHVHVLIEPMVGIDLAKVVSSWKTFSTKAINRVLNEKGAFWQREWYDHIIRTYKEYMFQLRYIWDNPGAMRSGFSRKLFSDEI